MSLKITLIGAGSDEFGPASIHDVLLSDAICNQDLELMLMDINEDTLTKMVKYAESVSEQLGRNVRISGNSDLETALEGSGFVITAIELRRYYYWAQDFHIPRKYGFKQIYGENGGVGGLFHALRNIPPTLEIARKMEKICPDAWLLNYTNPLTKLSEAINRLTNIKFVGLCHGVMQGKRQVAKFLEMDVADLDAKASGLNHITWFHSLKSRSTGVDLYPKFKEAERKAHWLAEWDELALSRMLLRTFGLYPSPGANHIGEYIRWAGDFLASDKLQFFYDPRDGHPWETETVPTWIYNLSGNPSDTPLYPMKNVDLIFDHEKPEEREIKPSGELAIPIIEGLTCGMEHELAAVNIPNENFIPGIKEEVIVEVPAVVNQKGLHPEQMGKLPEGILAILRTQVSINELLIEAFQEKSKAKLLQAILLDPTVDSFRNSTECMNELLELQKDVLPELY